MTHPDTGGGGTSGPGRVLIVLLPTARRERWEVLERALEAIEARPGWFAPHHIHEALGRCPEGSGATQQVIRELMDHGLLDRKGQYGYTRYRVRRSKRGVAA